MDRFIELFGWYGTLAIIGAYALVSFALLSPDTLTYQIMNATGAAGIVAVSLRKGAYQPALLNMVWTLIALASLARILF